MKQFLFKIKNFVLISTFIFLLAPMSSRVENKNSLDDMINKLEDTLKDQQNELLSIQEKNLKSTNSNIKNLNFKEYQITSVSPNQSSQDSEIEELSNIINQLESQVDKFHAEVQKVKQSILEQTRYENFIEIYLKLEPKEKLLLKTLNFKIDGFEVYKLNEYADIWDDSQDMLLYSGPMPIGEHFLELIARVGSKPDPQLKNFKEENYHTVNKSLNITIPQDKFRKKYFFKVSILDNNKPLTKLEEL